MSELVLNMSENVRNITLKDTKKLVSLEDSIYSIASIQKRGAFRTLSNVQDVAFEKMFNTVL